MKRESEMQKEKGTFWSWFRPPAIVLGALTLLEIISEVTSKYGAKLFPYTLLDLFGSLMVYISLLMALNLAVFWFYPIKSGLKLFIGLTTLWLLLVFLVTGVLFFNAVWSMLLAIIGYSLIIFAIIWIIRKVRHIKK